VALDRHSIEKRDFPTSGGGYDPEAVHKHLAQIAAEVEELQASHRRSDTLASSASEQVRAILEAAENSAAEIQRQATAHARDYLSRFAESAVVIRERLRTMESELSALLDAQPTAHEAPEPEPEPLPPGPTAPEPAESHEAGLAGGLRATGSAGAAGPRDDADGARLIALNMALNGTSREETDRYLSENFSLDDRASLLDEIYSSVKS